MWSELISFYVIIYLVLNFHPSNYNEELQRYGLKHNKPTYYYQFIVLLSNHDRVDK